MKKIRKNNFMKENYSGKVKANNLIKENYSGCWKFIKQNKNYIWFSALIFLFFALVGFVFPIFFKEQVISMLKQLIEKVQGYNAYELILFIIFNNFTTSAFSLISGMFFGILPLITLIFNGYILGFVAHSAVSETSFLVLWKLFPHEFLNCLL